VVFTNLLENTAEAASTSNSVQVVNEVEQQEFQRFRITTEEDLSKWSMTEGMVGCPYSHFKREGLHYLKDLLHPGDYMCKIDLKDAYFSIPLDPKSRKYVRFTWGIFTNFNACVLVLDQHQKFSQIY